MKKLFNLSVAILFAIIFASCDSSTTQTEGEVIEQETVAEGTDQAMQNQQMQEIEVVAENMRYNPSQIRVQPGQQVRIVLVNRGQEEHNIEFELPDGEQELAQNVQPGNRGTLEFTAPTQPGTYTVYCPVENHREKGMTGELIVE